jgi:hypothetical protein
MLQVFEGGEKVTINNEHIRIAEGAGYAYNLSGKQFVCIYVGSRGRTC